MSDVLESKPGRLDKWLFCARLCRTRAAAQKAILDGKIRLNAARVEKPGHAIRPGDVLTLALGSQVQAVKVQALAERRAPAAESKELYQPLPD